MILSASHLAKAFGVTEILKDVTFHLEDKEKVALVGINGAGKTTLFQILRGAYTADSGSLYIQKGLRIGYLPQNAALESDERIEDELLKVFEPLQRMEDKMRQLEKEMKDTPSPELMEQYSRLQASFERQDGYAYHSHVRGVLKGLGFAESEYELPITLLSGGQKSRVALSKLLLQKPDLLLLDEPTNHLDIDAITWLEEYLSSFAGAALIISHDRYFLDKICTRTIELERGTTQVYSGNYSFYIQEKDARVKAAMREYEAQQAEIRRQEEIIAKLRSFSQEKFIKRAQSREKVLERMDIVEKPITYEEAMKFTFTPKILSGDDVLTAHELSKAFDSKALFSHVNFLIKRGEKIALLGANGTGKSTLFKMIMGQEKADSGQLLRGVKVFPGYYDQEQQSLLPEKTALEEICDAYPLMTLGQVRNVLAAFLFRGDDVFKPIHTLSGGEKARISLCKIMLSECNFLLLDEPTNHLDILSREVLENNLLGYQGTLFFISHDRYFINRVATKIFVLTPDGIEIFLGNYDEYLAKQAEKKAPPVPTKNTAPSEEKISYLEKKQSAAMLRKLRAKLRDTERKIEQTEGQISGLDQEMLKPENYSSASAYAKLEAQKKEAEDALTLLYEAWEAQSSELEQAESSEHE